MRAGVVLVIGGAAAAAAAYALARSSGAFELEIPTTAEILTQIGDLAGQAPTVDQVENMTQEPNVYAFLQMIRAGEGTAGPTGYRMLFGGQLFDNFYDHPRIAVTRPSGNSVITSTAAGAYQILARTWDGVQSRLHLPDFSPQSQDAAAVELIRQRGALDDVRAGNFDQAVAKCAREWASLPGSPYGQPTRSLDQARAVYAGAGGSFA